MPVAHFRIDSAFIVDKARDCILEGNPQGVRILMDGLEGMDYDTAYAILRGEKTLKGISPEEEVKLVEDTGFATYRKQLANTYAGVLKIGNKFYQPSAYVFALGREDADEAMRQGHMMNIGSGKADTAFGVARVNYYRRGAEKLFDLRLETKSVIDTRPVFFAPLDWFPDFLTCFSGPKGAQTALDAFVAAERVLEARGPERMLPDDYSGETKSKTKSKRPKPVGPALEPTTKLHKYVKLDYDPDDSYVSWFEDINGMLCDLDGTPLDHQVSEFKVLETVTAEFPDKLDWRGTYLHRGEDDAEAGWITPEGVFYGCDYGQHRMLVEMMFKMGMEQNLLDDGYVKIWYGPKAKISCMDVRWICFKKLTDAQRATLIRMGHDTSDNDTVYRSDT